MNADADVSPLTLAETLPPSSAAEAKATVAPDGDDNAKALQIFAGAREAFLRQGFDGASMNDVARAAGVSKGTLYVYFKSKEELFEALIRHDRRRQAEQLCNFDAQDHDIRAVLGRFAAELLAIMLQPDHIAHYRMVVGAVAKFPRIGKAYYEAGPAFGIRRLSAYLQAQVESGHLDIADCDFAAQQFMELCQTGLFKKIMFAVDEGPAAHEIKANADRALDAFLKIYARQNS